MQTKPSRIRHRTAKWVEQTYEKRKTRGSREIVPRVFVHLKCLRHYNAVILENATQAERASCEQGKIILLKQPTKVQPPSKAAPPASPSMRPVPEGCASAQPRWLENLATTPPSSSPSTHTNTTQPVYCVPTVSQLAPEEGEQATFATFS